MTATAEAIFWRAIQAFAIRARTTLLVPRSKGRPGNVALARTNRWREYFTANDRLAHPCAISRRLRAPRLREMQACRPISEIDVDKNLHPKCHCPICFTRLRSAKTGVTRVTRMALTMSVCARRDKAMAVRCSQPSASSALRASCQRSLMPPTSRDHQRRG